MCCRRSTVNADAPERPELPVIGDHVWLGRKRPVLVQPTQDAQTQLVLQQPSGETLVRPKSSRKAAAEWRKGSTSLAPPPLLPLANFSTIRSFDGGGCPLVGGATRRGAGRNPSGGGWGGAMVGVGGWWGGRAPPRLIHPTTPPTEP